MGISADVAQVVAHILGKDEVMSSSLIISSIRALAFWQILIRMF